MFVAPVARGSRSTNDRKGRRRMLRGRSANEHDDAERDAAQDRTDERPPNRRHNDADEEATREQGETAHARHRAARQVHRAELQLPPARALLRVGRLHLDEARSAGCPGRARRARGQWLRAPATTPRNGSALSRIPPRDLRTAARCPERTAPAARARNQVVGEDSRLPLFQLGYAAPERHQRLAGSHVPLVPRRCDPKDTLRPAASLRRRRSSEDDTSRFRSRRSSAAYAAPISTRRPPVASISRAICAPYASSPTRMIARRIMSSKSVSRWRGISSQIVITRRPVVKPRAARPAAAAYAPRPASRSTTSSTVSIWFGSM